MARLKETLRHVRKTFWPDFSMKYSRNFSPDQEASQGGEDGIIEEICRRLQLKHGHFVEFGAWNGIRYSNTYALAKRGWQGVYIEGDPERAEQLAENMREYEGCVAVCQYLSAEGDNRLDAVLGKTDLPKDFDLLSIDIDGNDYWLWKSVVDYSPKIVVIEYNSNFKPHQNKVIRYDPEHRWDNTMYYGASAGALNQLAEEKGYTLVAYTPALNLFFVRNDCAEGLFEPLSVKKVPTRRLHIQRRREEFIDV